LYVQGEKAERHARANRKPVFLHMKTVRLLGHAGSDVETSYLTRDQIERTEQQDPLLHSARLVVENNILARDEVLELYLQIERRVDEESERAIGYPKLETAAQVRTALLACRERRTAPAIPIGNQRQRVFGADFDKLGLPQHMAKLINWGLRDTLLRYDNTVLFGQDVAHKGGVYNVTDGLHKTFGARRVFNSLLDEQSILGTAIGMAHNGFLPIPEIQFLAYVHNAEDQIRGEASTLAFFSQGQFTNPMVVRIAGLAYQKGFGGHFHNDNSLAVFRDIPGLIIAVPSNGADAVRMFRTCVRQAWENGRVCVFIEPIALYMTRDLHAKGDREWSFPYPAPGEEAALGSFRCYGTGTDALILTYGNGVGYSLRAQKELGDNHGLNISVVDLMWMAPMDRSVLLAKIRSFRNILIVDECRKTGSWSEGLVAMIVEGVDPIPSIEVVAADDCFIPLGIAARAGLPGRQDIVNAALHITGNTE
jgi:2-oxoisovalerate dehydrogenase E1 component